MAGRDPQASLCRSLVELYEPAQSLSVSAFGDVVFSWLDARLPLDSAALGTMFYGSQGVGYQAFRLHRQPIEKVIDYPAVAHLDLAARAMVRNIGGVSRYCVSADLAPDPENDPMRRYAARFGVAQSLTFCTREGNTGDAFALWRGSKRKPFLPGEARLAEALAPHLFLATRINASRFLAPSTELDRRRAVIVADRAGFITACDVRAIDCISREWPQWTPPVLPRPLLDALVASQDGRYVGRALHARCSVIESLLVITVRRPDVRPLLTPAQAKVAERLTRAGSYKQIGREFDISPATVRNHAHAVYSRLGLRSRSELVERLAKDNDAF